MEKRAEELRELQRTLKEKDEALAQRNREIKQMRLQTRKFADNHDYNEAQTRELLIDVMLRESGWDPSAPNVREYEVKGMPNQSSKGYVDYLLWDDNGKPLALVEAKRTTRNYDEGQHQTKLYADCLEEEFGVRPVIFMSNGYEIWIWDDEVYPPRSILGLYTKDSLQKLFFQRKERESLKLAEVNKNISGRYYQVAAIRRVGERFQEGHRRTLLVMATGTGKTRTAISITDMMLRKKWAKRVLFLADRNALVKQAYKNYADLLPDIPIVNLVEEKNDDAARVVFSTYPTMLNQIEKLEEGKRKFDPGHFDLVIIDEAHQSVYNKYQAIFDYFDSLLLGLTATPKEDVDHDTYNLFNTEQGNPTYAYGLEEAVKDGYLVPPKVISVTGKFASLIDNKVEYSQDLVEKFCLPEERPAIAISVDMMDTGIDAPDCANLVFFKPVRSKAKFNQMSGRGTRLRPDLFGTGRDKEHFLIFDYCGNFEFFEQNPEGYDTTSGASISAKPLTNKDIETLQQFLLDSDPAISTEEFREIVGEELDLIKFVRSVSGLKRETVIREFEEFLHDNRLSSNQIQFIE